MGLFCGDVGRSGDGSAGRIVRGIVGRRSAGVHFENPEIRGSGLTGASGGFDMSYREQVGCGALDDKVVGETDFATAESDGASD